MSEEFTKGPWRWLGNWLVPEEPTADAILSYTSADDGLHGKAADKSLLAAAPDMLAMLIEAAEFIQPFNRAEELLDRIDVVIAKARGAS